MRVFVTGIEGAAALNTMSVFDPLVKSDTAWRFLHEPSAPDVFSPAIVGTGDGPIRFSSEVSARPHAVAGVDPPPDLVIVPGLGDVIPPSLEANEHWVPWLRRWHDAGSIVASSCTGAFLLAEAGLLDGRRATTHWVAAPLFRASYPAVTLDIEPIIIDEGDVITSGGATTALNLVHYLVSRFGSSERAAATSHMLLLDSARESQLPFAVTGLHRQHSDRMVHEAQSLVHDRYAGLTVASLAHSVGVSTRTLGRRFGDAVGLTPKAYIDEVRIESAKRLLEQTSDQIADIRIRVGFTDPTAFRRAFKRTVGITPTEYRQRFGRRSALDRVL
ncbi:MAG: helix-turn-helix domain-containing protein [Acidimicrobiia bacterium]|nr:helix-turn-helix domain-containing protein [Acidimicrobiia bacterium]MDH4307619.1 helix-turn-helix domain-containing protein [Acidimicrobiia bacterium]MDH5294083.1 helix-turn-helix domain-containing protein [Acidimicrobiia bacterium]